MREPVAYTKWQNTTYDAILTAYNKLKMDYGALVLRPPSVALQ